MKKKLVFLAMLAIMLVFTMAVIGCKDESKDDNGGDGRISGWPNSTVLSRYGISGLTQPNDAANVIYFAGDNSIILTFQTAKSI